ncbi:hypothetical protein [Deinococcus sp. UYEF24]
MTPRHLLLLCALLSGPALAQSAQPTSIPVLPQSQVQRLDADELNAEVARRAPAYGGFYVKDGVLYVFVTSNDPARRQAAVRELFALQGDSLQRRGFNPASVVFLPGQFNAVQLLNAKEVARNIPGGQGIDIDETRNRVVVVLDFPEWQQQQAQAFVDQEDLLPGIVVFSAPPPGKLPEGPTFPAPHRARLDVPAQVAQGDVLTIELEVTNLSPQALTLEHGSCAFYVEVLDAVTRKAVLPIPGAFVCISDLRQTVIPAGGTVALAGREWNLRTPAGTLLPPGRYVVRAVFQVGALDMENIRPPDQPFEITAGKPGTGTAGVRDILQDGALGILFRARLGEEEKRQVVFVTVPDARAQTAVVQLLQTKNLSLDRVRFQTVPRIQVPQGPGDGPASLEVQDQISPYASAFGFVLNADLKTWLAQGAWRCQFVTQVIDQRTREVVGGWPSPGPESGPRSCEYPGAPPGFPWRGQWDGRRSDGKDAPAGTYEIRAGLKVTLRSGRIVWLLAPPQKISLP